VEVVQRVVNEAAKAPPRGKCWTSLVDRRQVAGVIDRSVRIRMRLRQWWWDVSGEVDGSGRGGGRRRVAW
jgi:hypothetical protein